MTDVALKEYLERQIENLRRELAIQREADMKALAVERENLRSTIRIDTLRWWFAEFLILITALASAVAFWRK